MLSTELIRFNEKQNVNYIAVMQLNSTKARDLKDLSFILNQRGYKLIKIKKSLVEKLVFDTKNRINWFNDIAIILANIETKTDLDFIYYNYNKLLNTNKISILYNFYLSNKYYMVDNSNFKKMLENADLAKTKLNHLLIKNILSIFNLLLISRLKLILTLNANI